MKQSLLSILYLATFIFSCINPNTNNPLIDPIQVPIDPIHIPSMTQPYPDDVKIDSLQIRADTIQFATVKDLRDGQVYRTIKIGSKTWMAENLNYNIPNSWCYDNISDYCKLYGRLYTWKAACDACPQAWHLPTDREWEILIRIYGGTENAGAQLKEGCNGGFNASRGGSSYNNGVFNFMGMLGYYWSSSPSDDEHAWKRKFYSKYDNVTRHEDNIEFAMSVRCVQN